MSGAHAIPDATATAQAVREARLGASESVERALAAIGELNPRLNAFLSVLTESARERARTLDQARANGTELGPLAGVPVALKGNMCLSGAEANCASKVLAGYRPPYNATFVERLLEAGAVPVGVTNLDEFAMGSSGENSAFGPTKNPWDLARTPGGSSSGSAASVAAGIVPLALGSDTGGSVRQPAALCGIVGFKPTYGRISRYGLIAFASSLDQVGILARSVRDVELALSVLSGHDERDSTSIPQPPVDPEAPRASLAGLRLGVPREYLPPEVSGEVRTQIEAALERLKSLGAELVDVSLPHSAFGIPTYYVVATAEASSNLARYDGIRYGPRSAGDGTLQGMIAASRAAGFGAEVKRRILLGTYVLSSGYYDAWYNRALKVRRLIKRDFDQAFESVDALVGPTAPTAAFKLGEKTSDPVAMYLNDVMTVPTSMAGLPGVSVPCGFVREGASELPVGLQFIGPALGDARLLSIARCYQEATAEHSRTPACSVTGAR